MPSDTRSTRRDRILALLAEETIPNQTVLRDRLADEGLEANQATLSRDLRALGIVKGPVGYVLPDALSRNGAPSQAADAGLARALADWLLDARPAQNILVLQTPPGGAQALGRAIDVARPRGVVGTLAGDDTILVVCPDAPGAARLARSWRRLARSLDTTDRA